MYRFDSTILSGRAKLSVALTVNIGISSTNLNYNCVKTPAEFDTVPINKVEYMKMLSVILIYLSLYSDLSVASGGSGDTEPVSLIADGSPICSTTSECLKYSKGGSLSRPLYRFGYYQEYVTQDLAAQACAHLNKRLPTIRELALLAMKKDNNRVNKSYPAIAIVEMEDFESGDPTKIPYGFKRDDFELIIGLVPTHVAPKNGLSVKIDGFYYSNANYKSNSTYLNYFTETSWVGWLKSKTVLDSRWPSQYHNVKDAYVFSVASGSIWWTTAELEITTMSTGAFTCVKTPAEEQSTGWRVFP